METHCCAVLTGFSTADAYTSETTSQGRKTWLSQINAPYADPSLKTFMVEGRRVVENLMATGKID